MWHYLHSRLSDPFGSRSGIATARFDTVADEHQYTGAVRLFEILRRSFQAQGDRRLTRRGQGPDSLNHGLPCPGSGRHEQFRVPARLFRILSRDSMTIGPEPDVNVRREAIEGVQHGLASQLHLDAPVYLSPRAVTDFEDQFHHRRCGGPAFPVSASGNPSGRVS